MTQLERLCTTAQPDVLAEFIRTTRRSFARKRTRGVARAHDIAMRVYRARQLPSLGA